MNVASPPVRAIAPDLLARFIALVGEKYAVTDPAEQEKYLVEGRNLYRGTSPAVLRPGKISAAEIAACLLAERFQNVFERRFIKLQRHLARAQVGPLADLRRHLRI